MAEAQYKVGLHYLFGHMGGDKDIGKAFDYFYRGAHQNHPPSQNRLALLFAGGRGTPKSDEDAVYWYRKAAENGHGEAMYNLGHMLTMGRGGCKRNNKEALKWFKMASETL